MTIRLFNNGTVLLADSVNDTGDIQHLANLLMEAEISYKDTFTIVINGDHAITAHRAGIISFAIGLKRAASIIGR